MKIIPTNDEFEAVLNMPANEVQELMPFHQIFLMEALRYSTSGNCNYFSPTYNEECGIIPEPPVDGNEGSGGDGNSSSDWIIIQVTANLGVATLDATKNINNEAVNSYAQVIPTGYQLAKNIVRVGGVPAVVTAINTLIGNVDWVLDSANNRVVYHDPQDVKDPDWQYKTEGVLYDTPAAACNAAIPRMQNSYGTGLTFLSFQPPNVCFYKQKNASEDRVVNGEVERIARAEPIENAEKYISYEVVGAEIAANAAAGDPAANQFVADTANPSNWNEQTYPFSLAAIFQQFESNAGIYVP